MEYLKIQHFKCFVDIDVQLNRLTVMAGANGNGKSTAVQALLYLRRTVEHCGEWVDNEFKLNSINGLNVPLNGVYCLAFGNSSFVLNRNYSGNTLTLGVFNDQEEVIVDYLADDREAKLWLTPIGLSSLLKNGLPIFKQQFYYLNAERIGPRVSQALQFSDYPNAGWQGETTAQLMALENGYYRIDSSRRFPGTESVFLQDQINFWLNFIMPGVKVKAEVSAKTLTAQVLIENQFTISEPTLATNVGFGISYVLPIIVTGLIAERETYFIIENPEAHLHPSAQTSIGRFLALVSKAGLNVVIETHSDHLINGIQLAVLKDGVDSESITINFFNRTSNSVQPEIQPISINADGRLSDWPNGFFDQTQIDFAELFNLRKHE